VEKHVRFGAIIMAALSLSAATNVAEAAHKATSYGIAYCGADFCHRHDVSRDCHDLWKDRGQQIVYLPEGRPCLLHLPVSAKPRAWASYLMVS
jgi:hypothetical protein